MVTLNGSTNATKRLQNLSGGHTACRCGQYLYAIVAAEEAKQDYGAIGIGGGVVYCLSSGPIAAIISDVPNERIRPERRHLAAHHAVLKCLMEQPAVLPVSFGIIADGANAIRHILSSNQEVFLEQLRRVHHKVEMGLKVFWDVPNVFEYFVSTHPELRALRDRLFRGACEPSQDDKIELGRLFDRTLGADRAAHSEKVIELLRFSCFEIKENTPATEREVMNLACLVGRDAQNNFEQGVFEAAKLFDNNFCFDFNGPWPPHNFVEADFEA